MRVKWSQRDGAYKKVVYTYGLVLRGGSVGVRPCKHDACVRVCPWPCGLDVEFLAACCLVETIEAVYDGTSIVRQSLTPPAVSLLISACRGFPCLVQAFHL